jgi:hypothetical protein
LLLWLSKSSETTPLLLWLSKGSETAPLLLRLSKGSETTPLLLWLSKGSKTASLLLRLSKGSRCRLSKCGKGIAPGGTCMDWEVDYMLAQTSAKHSCCLKKSAWLGARFALTSQGSKGRGSPETAAKGRSWWWRRQW